MLLAWQCFAPDAKLSLGKVKTHVKRRWIAPRKKLLHGGIFCVRPKLISKTSRVTKHVTNRLTSFFRLITQQLRYLSIICRGSRRTDVTRKKGTQKMGKNNK